MKAGFGECDITPVESANGNVGYVPTEGAFSPSVGRDETGLTTYPILEVTAGRKTAETGVDSARNLSPGVMPQTAQVEKVGQPWSYGTLGPDA